MANLSNINNKFIVEDSGDVGIGVTTATTKLHIGGTAPGDSIIRQDSTVSGTNWEIGERAAGKWQIFEDDGDTIVATFMSTGNVGIGTDSPATKLNIRSDASDDGILLEKSDGTDIARLFYDGTSTNARLDMFSGGSATIQLKANGITHFSGGNVGIGTASPSTLLHILGNSNGSDNILTLTNTKYGSTDTTGETGILFGWSNHSAARITAFKEGTVNRTGFKIIGEAGFNVPTTIATFRSTGNVGIGTDSPDGNLEVVTTSTVSGASDSVNNVLIGLQSANRPTIILDTADTTYTNRTWNITNVGSAGSLFFGRNGLDVLVMKNDGNVGIGTTSPSEILQTNKNSAGNIVGGYFTNSQANTGAESVSLAFGLNRSGGDFVRQVKAITFGAEQQWTGTPSTVDGYLSFSTVSNETVAERMRITSGGDVLIATNGKFLQGKRNTGSVVIDMIGFGAGTDTLQIKGGTSGAANAISFYDTGGFLGTWYNGNFGIGENNPSSLLHLKKATGDPMINIQAVASGDPGITFTSINNRTGNIFYSDGTTNAMLRYDHADVSFKLYAHNTTVADFVLNETTAYFPTQNVGIGTTLCEAEKVLDF